MIPLLWLGVVVMDCMRPDGDRACVEGQSLHDLHQDTRMLLQSSKRPRMTDHFDHVPALVFWVNLAARAILVLSKS